jgi:hypothetical protein
MKKGLGLLSMVLVSLLVGCASHSYRSPSVSVVSDPVGPNMTDEQSKALLGELKVYSKFAEERDGQNMAAQGMPVWYQHTDYGIYRLDGSFVKEVPNSSGHYSESAHKVELRPGKYFIKARAHGYDWIEVPITMYAGRLTMVHLDGNWNPPPDASAQEVVTLPDGMPIGYRARPM